ncbi:MAG: Ig domain-containing protein [Lachnospiraceae bacterium]|nr:Ig domain-containing protein [Lachnospiraceae bacterium]
MNNHTKIIYTFPIALVFIVWFLCSCGSYSSTPKPTEKTEADDGITQLYFSDETVSLMIGESSQLEINFSPANVTYNELTWKSSDETVVEVSQNGMIRGLSAGDATITVTHVSSGKTVSKKIEVLPISVERITVKTDQTTINEGESIQFDYSIYPQNANDQSVVWTSSDSSIITVSESGTVYGVGGGKATVTCSSPDGPSASVEITVKGKPVLMSVSFSSSCSDYNHVGDYWSFSYSINGEAVSNNTSVTMAAGDTIEFSATIPGADKDNDDVGKKTVTLSKEDIQNGFTLTWTVSVREGHGRYTGYIAVWTISAVVCRK